MTITPEYLIERCDDVLAGAGSAIPWVDDARRDSQTIDREADGLKERLRRSRNAARRLGAAAGRPMTVGFFGLSQAGKSYLISALACGANGKLETCMGPHRLNFISHVNPPGGGKEATGLVTRFTRQPVNAPADHPVALTLFSETDVVKILGNTFFLDFDHQRVTPRSDAGEIRSHLKALKARAQTRPTGGMTSDDVVDLMDYFVRRFPRSMEPFLGDFWPTAIDLAPHLRPDDRCTLFSLMWGEVAELSQLFLRLRQALETAGHTARVFAPVDVLVRPVSDGVYSQADSIMNVDMLERLGRDDQDRIEVIPTDAAGQPLAPVHLPRSVLAALTREMAFELAETPRADFLERVDLLDFPGYRGRLKVANLQEVSEQLENRDPTSELFLRGKVAYLFERYTDDQEMNVLVMCTPSHKQSDVNDLGPALETWIGSTQGATPDERARRRAGLVWAITMFDFRLSPKPDETEDLLRSGWEGMVRLTLLEKFESFEWVRNWSGGKPFDNVFLVRKPGMAPGVIDVGDGRETGVNPGQVQALALKRTTFLESPSVLKHVAEPAEAWEAMMTLDDGGMARLGDYLAQVARLDLKLARIEEQVSHITHELVENQLGKFYQGQGAQEAERKQALADQVIATLKQRAQSMGELLRTLQPSAEHLRSLYLKVEDEADGADAEGGAGVLPTATAGDGMIDLDLDLDDEEMLQPEPVAAAPTRVSGRARTFARAVVSDWTKQIRALPETLDVQRHLGIPGEILQIIVQELITGALRYKLEDKLVEALQDAEAAGSITRGRLADQQVLVARLIVNDFVDYFGFSGQPLERRPASTKRRDHRVFAPPRPIEGLPTLTAKPLNYPALFILDWFDAFVATVVGNAGHELGREITAEQNQRLGRLIARIRGQHAADPALEPMDV